MAKVKVTVEPTAPWEEYAAMVRRMFRDARKSSLLMSRRQARYLVDTYYQMQGYRIRSANQVRQCVGEPCEALSGVFSAMKACEDNIKHYVGKFAAEYAVGQWEQSVCGIGPVISAGFLAHLDIRMAKTVGHFYSFAGLNPTAVWQRGQKRPWNARLKVLCCHPSTLVETRRGSIPITEVVVGDEVLTHRGRYRRVTEVLVNQYDGEMVRLRARGFSRTGPCVTANHPVLTEKRRVCRMMRGARSGFRADDHAKRGLSNDVRAEISAMLRDGVSGAEIARQIGCSDATVSHIKYGRQRKTEYGNPLAWEQAGVLRSGDMLKVPLVPLGSTAPVFTMSTSKGLHNPPSSYAVEIDGDVARLLGLYLGDGHTCPNATVWSFGLHEDDVAAFVVRVLREKFGLRALIHRTHNMQIVRCGSKPLSDALRAYCGTHSHGKFIHIDLLRASRETVAGLIRGLFESDGCVSGKQAQFTSVNHQMIVGAWRCLHSLGIASTITPTVTKSVLPGNGREHVCHWYGLTIGDMPAFLRIVFGREAECGPTRTVARWDADGSWHTIQDSVRFDYSGPVYNLEVEEDRSYTANGIAVHNCFKAGECFVKVQNKPQDFYGKLYVARKQYEIDRNDRGDNAAVAAQQLVDKKIDKSTDCFKHLSGGKLPPAQLHARARRYAVKIFLSHLHHVMYRDFYGTDPPVPFAFEHCDGDHRHFIAPPNYPFQSTGKPLRELLESVDATPSEPVAEIEEEDDLGDLDE